jgi:hypothetical protein
MDGTPRNHHPRSAETIVFGHNHKIEFGAADPGILDLRGNGMPTAGAPNRQRRHRCIPAARDDQIGPRRSQVRTGIPDRTERQEPELRGQPGPGEADTKTFLDIREPGRFG